MRRLSQLTATAAALLAAGLIPMPLMDGAPRRGTRKRRNKTGETYPHSSARQRARYARQIAAGQLSMAGVERRV